MKIPIPQKLNLKLQKWFNAIANEWKKTSLTTVQIKEVAIILNFNVGHLLSTTHW